MKKVPTKESAATAYNRDNIYLTKQFMKKDGTLKISRSANSLEYLCRHGLRGKIHLSSTMSGEEIMSEIRSVFRRSFNDEFLFDILQPGGGKFKSLVVPSLSSSNVWTASAVAGSSMSPVYILTHTDLDVSYKHLCPCALLL